MFALPVVFGKLLGPRLSLEAIPALPFTLSNPDRLPFLFLIFFSSLPLSSFLFPPNVVGLAKPSHMASSLQYLLGVVVLRADVRKRVGILDPFRLLAQSRKQGCPGPVCELCSPPQSWSWLRAGPTMHLTRGRRPWAIGKVWTPGGGTDKPHGAPVSSQTY